MSRPSKRVCQRSRQCWAGFPGEYLPSIVRRDLAGRGVNTQCRSITFAVVCLTHSRSDLTQMRYAARSKFGLVYTPGQAELCGERDSASAGMGSDCGTRDRGSYCAVADSARSFRGRKRMAGGFAASDCWRYLTAQPAVPVGLCLRGPH
jgi:hypothetical protein